MEDVCNHEWRSPRHEINKSGEEVETLPVNHSCALNRNHVIPYHVCSCGEVE